MHLLPWLGEISGIAALSDAALAAPALVSVGLTGVLLWFVRDQLRAHPLVALLLLVGDAARWISANVALNSSGFSPTYGATFSPVYPVALVLPALYAFGVWLYVEHAPLLRAEE